MITVLMQPIIHGSAGKESACNAGDLGLILGLGRSPKEGKGYPLQYSCLENSMAIDAWKILETLLPKVMLPSAGMQLSF